VTQLDIFAVQARRAAEPAPRPVPEYVHGSETSRAAAVSMRDHVGDQALQVFEVFKAAGAKGATCDEVEERTGLPHQSASARVNWLKDSRRAWIIDSGATRATRSGRQATVWVVRAAAAGEVAWPGT
jgi:hypothetical protein